MILSVEQRPTCWDAPLWPVGVVPLWGSFVVAALMVKPTGDMRSLCFFHNVTGVPCPTCGSTRMMLALGRGDLLEALQWNPLLMIGLAFGAAWLFARIALRRRITVTCSASQRRALWTIAAVLFFANWIWLIARGT